MIMRGGDRRCSVDGQVAGRTVGVHNFWPVGVWLLVVPLSVGLKSEREEWVKGT